MNCLDHEAELLNGECCQIPLMSNVFGVVIKATQPLEGMGELSVFRVPDYHSFVVKTLVER